MRRFVHYLLSDCVIGKFEMKIRPICPELAEKAQLELNEDPNRIEGDIQHMKDWIAKQPHLRARTDDQWILAFLRGCKYSLERAKQKFDLYYTLRTSAPDLFQYKYNEHKFFEILELGSMLMLPKLQGVASPAVIIIRPGSYDPNKYHTSEIAAVNNVLQEIAFYENDTLVIAGGRAIIDLEGVNTSHFMQMTPSVVKKMTVMSQDAAPLRMKGAHYINTPAGFETVYNIFKAFLNEKNRNRLYVHNKNYDEMYQYISKDILPAEYGGNGGTIKEIIEYWKNKVKEYGPWLEEGLICGTDESKRPGKPKTAEDLFGIDGSFRQLQFD